MEQNKLKLEDCCLTMYQAKELQELGVDMSKSCLLLDCYGFPVIRDRIERTLKQAKKMGFKVSEYIPTLTNTEMLEMLPKEIDGYKLTFVYDYFRNGDDKYYIGYLKTYSAPLKELESTLLRNSLFGMIKWLKINKLM